MGEDPGYYPVVSSHLSWVLEDVGLNNLTIRRRRQACLRSEKLFTVYMSLRGLGKSTIYHFGSQSEGTTTFGLNSDRDTLSCYHPVNVIQDWVDLQQGKTNLLMLQEDTAPGYCRLQLLRSDLPLPREDLLTEHYTHDTCKRVILKNTSMHDYRILKVRNGPAQSHYDFHGFQDLDSVNALECKLWPRQAEQWKWQRVYRHWPGKDLTDLVLKTGIFLVPVGHRLSQTENLEWRFSFSLAERFFIFSMNMVHVKCLVVLKMLIKTFITPYVGKCISSYHCKTALFHCVESTGAEFWRENNLVQCIIQCLTLLFTWVGNGFCPHFIIAEENLFDGKIGAHNRCKVQSILRRLIKSHGLFLLYIPIGDLGHKLQVKLSTKSSQLQTFHSAETKAVFGNVDKDVYKMMNYFRSSILAVNVSNDYKATICSVYQKITMLCERLRQPEQHGRSERRANQNFIEFLCCWLGTLLSSVSLSRSQAILPHALQWFRIGAKSDIASKLKLASSLIIGKDVRKAEILLRTVEENFYRSPILTVCSCYRNWTRLSKAFCYQMYALEGEKQRDMLVAHCVIFSPQEIHCAAPALRKELQRADGVDQRYSLRDQWMKLAVVDCLPYLYYLQCLIYRQAGKEILRKRSIHNLEYCLRNDQSLRHLETGWNLLGQCMELEQDVVAAIACYRTSLAIRPRNNAAKWHMQNMCLVNSLRSK